MSLLEKAYLLKKKGHMVRGDIWILYLNLPEQDHITYLLHFFQKFGSAAQYPETYY